MSDEKSDDEDLIGAVGFNLSDKNLVIIGGIIVRFAYLENFLEIFIDALSGLHQKREASKVILSSLDFNQKLAIVRELLSQLLKDKAPQVLRKFGSVDDAIQRAQGGRNKIAHAKWYSLEKFPDLAVASYTRMKSRLKSSLSVMTADDFQEILVQVDDAITALEHFLKKDFPPPRADTP